ncbi:interleukin-36 receptor antagonist protein isoform X3 [Anolis carolinensis]|uniref:interleukin-36 receptor antagonist protein isoform X3 n=1 Tax=Anolis carolinensis TaxID=28377 RepID=UPI0007DB85D9|nr:PREDICTED: interleukin-36 receptor antagonist protein isoform X3 [Anolis carolinensis]XP_016851107.1 PREDICTED: interleukin-36 receptor antagonist protein isoform X3 [Anolis carolinensis]|eukprot:XP_016851106.1 PREDICTED: interleukin-36 receptor antagonist protein isoform X3 [Anolis carolinensis]
MDSKGSTSHTPKPQEEKECHKKTWNEEIADLFPKKPMSGNVPVKVDNPYLYRIWDVSQKYFFLVNNILVAKHQDSNAPELLMEVFPNTVLDPEMMPIFMGPQGSKQCLSCEKSPEGQIQLQLKEGDIKTLYDKKEESLAFTLYSKTDGSPETCSFESAEFPVTTAGAIHIVKTCP